MILLLTYPARPIAIHIPILEGSSFSFRSSRNSRADRMRVNVFCVIVWPADGDAFTVLPGKGVGLGHGLVERKSGWMLDSRVEPKLEKVGDGSGDEGRETVAFA